MGRWAQQRKRGGHVGGEAGLPAGPSLDLWAVDGVFDSPVVQWNNDGAFPFNFWRSRWRVPALTMLWTLALGDIPTTNGGETQSSPFDSIGGQEQDVELVYCDVAGNPLSDWSGYAVVVP